jgi:NCS2 family nucleobase:cation symporter-2
MSLLLAHPLRQRPEGLTFDLDELPPWTTRWLLGLQHFFVIVPNITIVLLVARAAKSDADVTSAMLSLTLLGLAISTLLQTNVRTGSGFFIPGCPSGIYASVSLTAAATGGLPLVYGMTLMAGLLQMGFSRLITRMRHLFPSEIVGLSVIIVGIELGAIGLQRLSSAGGSGLLVGASTFFVSVFLGVYGRGTWKLYCAMLGIFVGYVMSFAYGLIDITQVEQVLAAPLIALPTLEHIHFAFDGSLVLPFMFAAIASSLKTMGAVVSCEKINDANWMRPNMRLVQKGVLVDGLATTLAGSLGSTGTNSATSSVGVSHATGATSRTIGTSLAALMCLFAMSPEFLRIFVAMPDAVVGGGLLFAACLVTVNGLHMLGTVSMDMRRAGVIAFPLLLAVAKVGNSPVFLVVPECIKPMVSSALTLGVFAAILVNAFFRFGATKRVSLVMSLGQSLHDRQVAIRRALDACGVAHNVRARVLLSLHELLVNRISALDLRFDGCTLRADLAMKPSNTDLQTDRAKNHFFLERLSDEWLVKRRAGQADVLRAYYFQ